MELGVLIPSYGRDYKSKTLVLKDWVDGKDFTIAISGQQVSLRDVRRHLPDLEQVTIRYRRLSMCVIIKRKDWEGHNG